MSESYEYWNGEAWVQFPNVRPTEDGGVTWAPAPSDWKRGGRIVDEDGNTVELDDLYYMRKACE